MGKYDATNPPPLPPHPASYRLPRAAGADARAAADDSAADFASALPTAFAFPHTATQPNPDARTHR